MSHRPSGDSDAHTCSHGAPAFRKNLGAAGRDLPRPKNGIYRTWSATTIFRNHLRQSPARLTSAQDGIERRGSFMLEQAVRTVARPGLSVVPLRPPPAAAGHEGLAHLCRAGEGVRVIRHVCAKMGNSANCTRQFRLRMIAARCHVKAAKGEVVL